MQTTWFISSVELNGNQGRAICGPIFSERLTQKLKKSSHMKLYATVTMLDSWQLVTHDIHIISDVCTYDKRSMFYIIYS